MRLPRVRLTVAALMGGVAASAVVSWVCMHIYIRSGWTHWLDHVNRNPLLNSGITARIVHPGREILAGETIDISVIYRVAFSRPKPPSGMYFEVEGDLEVWDMDRRVLVGEDTFRRTLIAGVGERPSIPRTLKFRHPSAGNYCLATRFRYKDFLGRWRRTSGGGEFYKVLPSGDRPSRSVNPHRQPSAREP